MRIFLIISLLLISVHKIAAQNNDVTKKSADENLKQFASSIFKYPSFLKGKIILTDSSVTDAKLNYNRVLGKIVYLDRMNKGLPLEDPATIAKVIIATDTFYLFENNYIEKYTHCAKVNLYIKQSLAFVEKKDNSPKDNLSPVIITNGSKLPYSSEEIKSEDYGIQKNSTFQLTNDYFIADSSMNYLIASKKSIFDLFPSAKEPLKKYLQQNTVNFNDASQIEKLLEYMDAF